MLGILLNKIYRIFSVVIGISIISFGILTPIEISCKPGISIACLITSVISGSFILFSTLGLKKIVEDLKKQNEEYKNLNTRLSESVKTSETQLDSFKKNIEKLEKTNKSLVLIQAQSQQLLENLMQSGDEFKDFGKILNETTKKNLKLTDKLTELMKGLSKETFKKYDKNGDGVITLEELN